MVLNRLDDLRITQVRPLLPPAILLEEIHVPGLTIAEREISPSELEESDQVFITSTTRDLLPVISVDGAALPQDRTSLAMLQRAFAHYRESYVAKRAKESLAV